MTNISIGDYWSRFSYGIVIDTNGQNLRIKNEDGFEWNIANHVVEQEFTFHNKYEVTEEVTATKLEEIFRNSVRIITTVCFNKQPKQSDVADKIKDLYPNKGGAVGIKSKSDFEAEAESIAKLVTIGEERIIIGRHYGKAGSGGRVQFIDIEARFNDDADKGFRQVDPRQLNWIIVSGVKYILKSSK